MGFFTDHQGKASLTRVLSLLFALASIYCAAVALNTATLNAGMAPNLVLLLVSASAGHKLVGAAIERYPVQKGD